MFIVYILKDVNGKVYKGVTGDLDRRLSEHISGNTKSTRSMKKIEIVYSENYSTFKEAREREKYFKTAAGRRWLKKRDII